MTTIISVLFGLLFAVAVFYWAVASFIAIGVAVIRVGGSSSTSALPGVASFAGMVAVAIGPLLFGWIRSPSWMLLAIAPDSLFLLGSLVFWMRVGLLKLPDKALRKESLPEANDRAAD